ncbi:MAG: ComF family protein, partial [Ruminococcus sp.]|nr:ComF family protein [Ruminococcus sp.]
KAYSETGFDLVTCVPMHEKQLKERGYNQSRLLAENVSNYLEVEYEDLLVKHKENLPQHNLKPNEKRYNVKGVYKAVNTDKIKGHNILIIDDVITTGYTLGECCKILQKAGAKKIQCAALCAKL